MDLRPLGFLGLVIIGGCCGMCAETTPSENVRTEGLSLTGSVEATGSTSARVSITIRAGGPLSNLFPKIGASDRLEVRGGGAAVPLAFDKGIVSMPSYLAEVPGDPAGKTFQILFTRTGNTSATGTRVTMPAAFTLSAPSEGQRVSLAHQPLSIAWSPVSTEPVSVRVEGACVEDARGSISPDTGHAELSLHVSAEDGGAAGGCRAKIIVERASAGVVDPAFGEGGSIHAVQRRERTIEITP